MDSQNSEDCFNNIVDVFTLTEKDNEHYPQTKRRKKRDDEDDDAHNSDEHSSSITSLKSILLKTQV